MPDSNPKSDLRRPHLESPTLSQTLTLSLTEPGLIMSAIVNLCLIKVNSSPES